MTARRASLALAAAAALAAAPASDAASATPDTVARGLDLFIQAPSRGAPGGVLPVQVLAYGFPSVVSLRPLDGAAVEAVWDPESLGKVSSVPAPVRVTTDPQGRAHLDVPIPDGPARSLTLLLGVRVGDRARTQSITVERYRPYEVDLLVPDSRVVPGGATSAWIVVRSASTGQPVPATPVEVRLLEGGLARHKTVVTTDAAGTAMARVPIPWTDEPSWSWQLEAQTIAQKTGTSASGSVTLTPREETPGAPQMLASWAEGDVRAGEKVAFTVRIRDGAGQPVAGLPVRTWVGPKGTSPPDDKTEWEKASTLSRTDPAGEIRGEATAPSTVVQGVGSSLRLVARATLDGHDLSQDTSVSVDNPTSSATLEPEAGAIVPGLEQRMLLRVLDARYDPVAATFTVEGDGLRATVTTDAHGEAEVTWKPPHDLGAMRNVGPCAGGVAAAVLVRPVGDVPALASRRGPFELCVQVSRDAAGIVRTEPLLARQGDRALVRVFEAGKGAPGGAPWSVVVETDNSAAARSAWIDDGERGGGIELGAGAPGIWGVSAASPRAGGPARVVGGGVMVAPRVLPALTAKLAGGRATPKGTVDVELALGDGHGRGLPGTIAAVMVDLHGGGSVSGLVALDTRSRLCGRAGIEPERCDPFLEGDPALEPLRRAALSARTAASVPPVRDPGGTAREELNEAFGEVLRSLEGAVFEAAESPDRLADVRRRGPGGGWQFNPELMTLVTAAMSEAPMTPGGEPLALGDLLAIDPQVTFDNVARRITRLKLFRVLAAARAYRRERMLDPDEPALSDPNALLRRLVRDGRVEESLLIDPWGGTLQFVKTGAAPFPFLTVTRGFALQAPGPDGRIGTGDDVRDPFERVLRSGSPYARAVSEDRLVDAKFDMEVSEETVSAWQSLIESLTGTALGGLGLTGTGEGGGGRGEGIGLGRIGTIGHGAGRSSFGIPTGVAFWSPPRRTDKDGRLRISVPLGDAETTWRIGFVGVPDGATPATTTLDVPVALPLSARVDTGAAWIEGDVMDAAVMVRNRGAGPVRAALAFEARGSVSLVDPRQAQATVEVAAGGAAVTRVRLKARAPGRAELAVRLSAPGVSADALLHAWDVRPAGELTDMTSSSWVGAGAPVSLSVPVAGKRIRLTGEPRVVLERGVDWALEAALGAMDPDRLSSPDAMADAVEVGSRLMRWATTRRGERSPLAVRAGELSRRAMGRLHAYRQGRKGSPYWAAVARARALAPIELAAELPKPDGTCPPKRPPIDEALDALDAEPAPAAGVAEACWDAFVTDTVTAAIQGGDRVELARAVLALAERPHRAAAAAALADRLREAVKLRASGGVTLPDGQASERASRAIVYAALLRAASLGKPVAPAERLAAWLGVQRDGRGGYGSALATRSAVRALLSHDDGADSAPGAPGRAPHESAPSAPSPATPTQVTIISGGVRREVTVGPSARISLPLDASATRVEVTAVGPGVVARLERPVLRLWSSPPDDASSPVRMEITWPARARAGKTGVLGVSLRHTLDRPAVIDARIPLPPGVSLAEPVNGVHQIQGTLVVRAELDSSRLQTLLEIPVRFALAGTLTAPEARARVAFEDLARAVAPARPVRIE